MDKRKLINQFLQYPEDSAGSLMTIEYVDLKKEMTVKQAIERIQKIGVDKETIDICYVIDQNRKLEGIVGDLSVTENISLALQAKRGIFKKISRQEAQKIAEEYIKKLDIRTPSANQQVKNLSGGNQQKVIMARCLARVDQNGANSFQCPRNAPPRVTFQGHSGCVVPNGKPQGPCPCF